MKLCKECGNIAINPACVVCHSCENRRLTARLRDAEARVAELGNILTTLNGLGYLSHWWEESTDARDVKIAARNALSTTTSGACNRLRNEVLEEAAGIIMEQYQKEKEGLNNFDVLVALYVARFAIRAAKKVDQ